MANITTRTSKGLPLSFAEMDANFETLNAESVADFQRAGQSLRITTGTGSTRSVDVTPFINYENLNNNNDVGAGADQLARGNHSHLNYIDVNGDVMEGNLDFDPGFELGLDHYTVGTKELGLAPLDGNGHVFYLGLFYLGTHAITITSSGDFGFESAELLVDVHIDNTGSNNSGPHEGAKIQWCSTSTDTSEFRGIHSVKVAADQCALYLYWVTPLSAGNQTLVESVRSSHSAAYQAFSLNQPETWTPINATIAGSGTHEAETLLNLDRNTTLNWRGQEVYHQGNLTANTLSAVSTSRNIVAGSGLTGGGTLVADRTLNVGAGTGINVSANTVGLDTASTRNIDHTEIYITGSGGLLGGGDLTANRSITLDNSSTRNVDHSTVNITAGNGLIGGGNISASRTLNVVGGDGITANANDITVDNTVVRTTRTINGKALSSNININQSDVINYTTTGTNKTLSEFEIVYCTASGLIITLPASPSEGDFIGIIVGNFDDVVVARNGSTIMGLAENLTLDRAYVPVNLVYLNNSWRITS